MKLWVLYSNKHENGFAPKTMQKSAKENEIDCKVFYFEYFSFLVENGKQKLFYKSKEIKTFPDFAFVRGYDLPIRLFLQQQGVKFVNSTNGALTSLDKLKTHFVASKLGLNQPKTLYGNLDFDEIEKQLKKPFVMKDRFGAKGNQVFLINSKTAFNKTKKQFPNTNFVFQEFVKSSKGQDLRLYVVGNHVVGAIKRISQNGDFRSNLSLGGKAELFLSLPVSVKKQAEKLAKSLDLHFCSVDFLISNNQFLFCEANANASFWAFFECGLNLQNQVMHYIKKQK